MRFLSFSSGSCGNCCLLLREPSSPLEEPSGILIDAGVGIRKVRREMDALHLSPACIRSILVTHDHGDHIRNLGSFCKRWSKPVYATERLHQSLLYHPFTRGQMDGCRRDLVPGAWNEVAPGMEAQYFIVPHDATETVGYAIRCEGELFVLMTDLGHVTEEAMAWASQASTVVVESNYDVEMLLGGDYPYDLKMRICQGIGHLSNDACADAIRRFWHPGLRNLFLCHLSGNNNTPQLAYDNAAATLRELGVEPGTVHLRVLYRGEASPLISL